MDGRPNRRRVDQPLVAKCLHERFLCHFQSPRFVYFSSVVNSPFFKKSVKVVIGNFDFLPLAKEEKKVTYER